MLLDLRKNITSISNFSRLAIDDIKTFNSRIDTSYSINESKTPMIGILKELETLEQNINTKILINLDNELVKMK